MPAFFARLPDDPAKLIIQFCREVGWGIIEVMAMEDDEFLMWLGKLDEVLRAEAEQANG